MHPDERARYSFWLLLGLPVLCWFIAVKKTEELTTPKIKALFYVAQHTHEKPILLGALVGGLVLAILIIKYFLAARSSEFGGAPFRKFLRGTQVVDVAKLKRATREKGAEQIEVAGIPMPSSIETLHLLVSGSTGSGKSVLMRAMVFSILKRFLFRKPDRLIILDPNGDMLSKFGRKKDKILNPYDARTEGWSFFNEIRNDYDFKRYALSIVPRGKAKDEEEWRGYGRLLLQETARKLALMGNPSVRELFRWTTIAKPDDLKEFLKGTAAESLFVGADKALASARFVLSKMLPEHLEMPAGDFSLRTWLEDDDAGNLYITWREDMAEALKPLISAWVDTICTSVLSLPEDEKRRLWMFIDELASLEKLPSLEAAATKGRKAGLRLVVGLQSTAQLDDLYGPQEAQTLRSCFRSLVVLGGAKTDPKTCEDMSKSLGEHEVERDEHSKSISDKGTTRTSRVDRKPERVVMPSQIASLPDLTGYLAFAGDRPITRVTLEYVAYKNTVPAFEERAA
jgi:type IV secretory pathway TraG/TraD family ATPase VirD4